MQQPFFNSIQKHTYAWNERKQQFTPRQIALAADVVASKDWVKRLEPGHYSPQPIIGEGIGNYGSAMRGREKLLIYGWIQTLYFPKGRMM